MGKSMRRVKLSGGGETKEEAVAEEAGDIQNHQRPLGFQGCSRMREAAILKSGWGGVHPIEAG
jgi:hypothetical protein